MTADESTDASSAPEPAETASASRRLVLAVAGATVAPAAILLVTSYWLATPPTLGRSLAALVWAAAIAWTLRGIGVVARWAGIGPDPLFERWLWGTAFAVGLSLAAAWATRTFEWGIFGCVYSGVLFAFWSVIRFAYREPTKTASLRSQTWRLRDMLVAMAVVCLLAAGTHFVMPSREIEPLRLAVVMVASLTSSTLVAMATLVFDAGIRVFILESDEPDARTLLGVVAFGAIAASVIGIGRGLLYDLPYTAMVAGFVGSYLTIAVVQDVLLARRIDAQECRSASNERSP